MGSSVLSASFFQRDNVILIARELLGKALFSTIGGELTGGIIIETESYRGARDRACHAYNNRRTKRTKVMFQKGGVAYVYLCYGIHCLLNVVTAEEDVPHAVLIRAITPTHGLEIMQKRRNKRKNDPTLTSGPGALCQALGISRKHNGLPLNTPPLWIEATDLKIKPSMIIATPRIGVEYAGEDAKLPWRFVLSEDLLDILPKSS
jgi:DNA-3-methyladenine glycosylase